MTTLAPNAVRARAGDRDPLRLPDGDLPRVAGREALEAERGEELADPGLPRLPREAEGQPDVLPHGEVVDQVVGLEHETDLVEADLRELGFLEPRDLATPQADGPARRNVHPAEDREERRLPASVRTPQEDRLPSADVQVHAPEDVDAAVERLPDVRRAQDCVRHRPRHRAHGEKPSRRPTRARNASRTPARASDISADTFFIPFRHRPRAVPDARRSPPSAYSMEETPPC